MVEWRPSTRFIGSNRHYSRHPRLYLNHSHSFCSFNAEIQLEASFL